MDQFYYESGYIDESYFVYTADAESSAIFEASISCDANVLAGGVIVDGTSSWLNSCDVVITANRILESTVTIVAIFNQVCTISHIHGSDLFAMSNALLSAQANVIRNNNIMVTGAYTVTANAERTRLYTSAATSTVDAVINNSRIRYELADMSSAFSMSTTVTKLIKLESSISTRIDMVSIDSCIRNSNIILDSNFTSSQSVGKLVSIIGQLSSSFTGIFDFNKLPEYWISSSGNQIQDIAFDSTGNIIGAGQDGTIFKRGKYGNILSQFALSSNSTIKKIVLDANDNMYILAWSYAGGINGTLVAKISNTNTILWQKIINPANSTGRAQYGDIKYDQSSDSIVIVGDWVISTATPITRASIIRINSSGTVVWNKFLTRGTSHVGAYGVKISGSYVYVVGTSSSNVTVSRLDFSTGTLSWVYGMATTSASIGDIDVDSNGYVYICGDLGSTVSTSKLFLLKLNSFGVQQWNRTIDYASSYEYQYDMSIYNDEIYISAGSGVNDFNSPIIKFDTSGNLIFQRLISTSNNDYSISIAARNQVMYIDGNYSAQLPIDGSMTGTYSIFNYAESSATISTDGTISLYSDTVSFTNNTGSPVFTTSSLTLTDPITPVSYSPTFISVKTGAASMTASSAMQANVTRNIGPFSANLSSTSTLSGTVSKISSARANLQVTGFEIVTIGKIIPEFAGLDSQFVMSARAGRVIKFNAALMSQFTVLAAGLDVDLAVANLSSTSNLTINARNILGDHRETSITETLLHFESFPLIDSMNSGPVTSYISSDGSDINIDLVSGAILTTGKISQAITQGRALANGRVGDANWTVYPNYTVKDSDFVVEAWHKSGGNNTSTNRDTVIFDLTAGAATTTNYTWAGGSGTNTSYMGIRIYNTNAHNLIDGNGNSNNWGLSNGQVYVNWGSFGSLMPPPPAERVSNTIITDNVWYHFLISRTGTTHRLFINGILNLTWTATPATSTVTTGILGGVNSGGTNYLDEFRLRKGVTQTTNFTPSTLAYPEFASLIKNASMDVISRVTITANGMKVKTVSATLNSQFTQIAQGRRYKNAQSILTSNFTQTTVGRRAAILNAALQSSSTLTESLISRTRQMASYQQVTTTAQIIPVKKVTTGITVQAIFTDSINNGRVRGTAATLNSVSTMAVQATRIARGNTAMSAFVTELVALNRIGRGLIHMDSIAEVTAHVTLSSGSAAALTSRVTMSAQVESIVRASAIMGSTGSISALPTYLRHTESVMQATMLMTTRNVRTRGLRCTAQMTMNLVVTNYRVKFASAALTTRFNMVTQNQIVRLGRANLQSTTNLAAIGGTVIHGQGDWTAFTSELAMVDVLHIDPYYQILIPAETRGLIITQETRVISIDSETRVNKIKGLTK